MDNRVWVDYGGAVRGQGRATGGNWDNCNRTIKNKIK